MKYLVFLFVGVILLGTAILVYYILGLDNTNITVNGVRDNSDSTRTILQYSVGGFLAGLGLIFIVAAMRARSRAIKQQKQNAHILKTGVAAEAKVIFVDKNYSFLVNNNPIYSIIEYTYQGSYGQQHMRRIETFSSDTVIRKQIQVGGMISIKYATEDSSMSVMVL